MGWKLNTDRQIWMQLTEILTRRVVSGQYPAGVRIPSVRDLAAEAGVNPNTMQRALVIMEDEGLLTSQRNTGRYVTQDTDLIAATRGRLAQEELSLFCEKMKQLGYTGQEIKQFAKIKHQFLHIPARLYSIFSSVFESFPDFLKSNFYARDWATDFLSYLRRDLRSPWG